MSAFIAEARVIRHILEGTTLFVSHDQTLLRGLASRVLETGGEDGTGRPVTHGGTREEPVARSGHARCVFPVPGLLRPFFVHDRALPGPL